MIASSTKSDAYPADFRQSALYGEAEVLFRNGFRPGSGRPVAANDLQVSPDGRCVAFTGVMLDKLEGVPTTRICMADLSKGQIRVLSFGPGSDLQPKFSPDGKTLAFRSDRASPGNFQLYFLDLLSGMTTAAPVVPGWVEYLDYSPGGQHMLLGVAPHGADVAGVQGAKTTLRSDVGPSPAWMPTVDAGDTSLKRRSVWILDLADTGLRRISANALNVWEASWCGDQALAAVVSPGAEEQHWYRAHIALLPLDGGKERMLYQPKDQLGCLSSSPDGRQLAFAEAVCSDRCIVAGDLRIVDLDTGKVREVPCNEIDVTFTRWRDNHRLLIAGLRNLDTVIADIDVPADTVQEGWTGTTLYCASGVYPAAAPCPDGSDFLICATGHLQAPQLLHIGKGGVRKCVDLGHDGTAANIAKLRPVEPYRWNAPDGTEIQGWLMRGDDKGPAPLVMEVHGGPISRWSPFFIGRSAYHMMLAQRGYAIFWPNPRGSSGRGQAFAGAVVGDMGGADTQDYLSGLDQLVAEGIADPLRIGVMGGSYGGFMTSWLITQDSRFAAAVPVAPVTNWVSQHLTSNLSYFDTFCLGSEYNEAGGNHFARSPVMFAHKVKTPTLNICGALDRCTPPGQALEFHNALLGNGVESVLVTYPQEGHGVRTFPGMIDYAARVVDWFLRHMAPGSSPA